MQKAAIRASRETRLIAGQGQAFTVAALLHSQMSTGSFGDEDGQISHVRGQQPSSQ